MELKVIIKLKKYVQKIFLDLKLHDIPNTVQNGMIAIKNLNHY